MKKLFMDGKAIQFCQLDKRRSIRNIIKTFMSLLGTPAEWKHEWSIFQNEIGDSLLSEECINTSWPGG